ncbi:hypothetical protein [Sphingomonas sp. G-3-2-10]|uniref:hypothetical protein n=1 Tax=Sphingomonas sp. G-3-2-10 TaxID=2728838 RepID=UPI00146BF86B|nr:hypothetical protein [Sphingomonas sp. G-3-2-10]NML06377.1 hypothetical protein [Sphingomonas sp. G-3-2-10]
MAEVASGTAWNDCREALRAEIAAAYNDNVQGNDWVIKKPSSSPPKGYSAGAANWGTTLRSARAALVAQGYAMDEISVADTRSVLDGVLNASVQLLYDKVTTRRQAWAVAR